MTIYIDNANIPYRRMIMNHMISDESLDELHEMAQKLGLKRRWFQDKNIPHYDISLSKKKMAIGMGAVEVTSRELIEIYRSTFPSQP